MALKKPSKPSKKDEKNPKKIVEGPSMDYSDVAFPKPTPKKRKKR